MSHPLPGGSLPEMISPYMRALIERTGGAGGPIGLQFVRTDLPEDQPSAHTDIQEEATYEAAPGVIYKYRGALDDQGNILQYGRALWTISRFCATYCRFCFRGRLVGLPANVNRDGGETLMRKPYLDYDDIETVIRFLRERNEINEVILSGGDPLVAPQAYLEHIFGALGQLQQEGVLDFVRVHTRAPVTNPVAIRPWHLALFLKLKMPHVVLHVNHPAELTDEVRTVINAFRSETDTLLFSQTVLLKGVNDSVETLQTLFVELAKLGIRPYYLHYNDPVYWARSFAVPMPRAVGIWRELRRRLSGIAGTAKFVVDAPYGRGKVPVPEAEWSDDFTRFSDFDGVERSLVE
jgi:lysine 2,3-aminomutase